MIINVDTKLKEVCHNGIISQKTYICCVKAGINSIGDLIMFSNNQPIIKMKGCGKTSVQELNRLLRFENLHPTDDAIKDVQFAEELALSELHFRDVISVRALNCCIYNDINTVGELSRYVKEGHSLLDLRNCGKKTVKELEDVLKKVCFQSKLSISNQETLFNSLPEQISKVVTDNYNIILSSIGSEDVEQFKRLCDTPSKYYSLFSKEIHSFVLDILKIENDKLRKDCYQLLTLICNNIDMLGLSDIEQCKILILNKKIMPLVDENLEIDNNNDKTLTELIRRIIESDYEDRIKQLPKRARRAQIEAMPNYIRALTFFNASQKDLEKELFPGQMMRLTCIELFNFLKDFKTAFYSYLSCDDSELISKYVSTKFPFLLKSQREFVYNFNLEYGHYPMFFILIQYFSSSDKREDCVFAMLNGLYDGHRKTLEEIGELFGLSRERVRQIASKGPSKWLIESSEWKKYNLENNVILYPGCEAISKIVTAEKLDIGFDSVMTICSYVFPLSLKKTKGWIYLIPKRLDFPKLLSSICRQIERMMVVRYSEDYSFSVDGFLTDIPNKDKEEYKHLLTEIIRRAYKLEIDSDGYIAFPQIRINFREELYQILRQKGSPLSLEELFYELKQKYPDIKYEHPNQIRSFVLNEERIKAIGKTSIYGLAEWKNVYYGSIRELIIQILTENDNPVHIDDLMKQVLVYYPNTNKKSIVSNMYVEQEKFVLFIGGYYGLSSKKYKEDFVVSEDVARYTFDERLEQLEMFISTYNRFPFNSGGVEESSIARWLWRVINEQSYSYEQVQMDRLKELFKKYENLPQNGIEYEFLTNCKNFREFVESTFSLPKPSSDLKLYNWFRNAKNNYYDLDGNKKEYFSTLLNDLRDLEFDV